jgi:SPX domain
MDSTEEALLLKQDRNECVFFKLLYAEMNKATHFFEQTQLQYQLRVGQLQDLLDTDTGNSILQGEQRQAWAQNILHLHQDLLRLETFAIMTYCGLSKILKKHDKVTGFHTRNAFMANVVHPASITHTPQLQAMIQKCQDWLAKTVDLPPRRQRQPQVQHEHEQLKPSERDQQLFWDTIQKLRTSSSPPPSLMSLLTLQEANQPHQNWKSAVLSPTAPLPHRRQVSDVDSSATAAAAATATSTSTSATKKRTLSEDLTEETVRQRDDQTNCKRAKVQLAV